MELCRRGRGRCRSFASAAVRRQRLAPPYSNKNFTMISYIRAGRHDLTKYTYAYVSANINFRDKERGGFTQSPSPFLEIATKIFPGLKTSKVDSANLCFHP